MVLLEANDFLQLSELLLNQVILLSRGHKWLVVWNRYLTLSKISRCWRWRALPCWHTRRPLEKRLTLLLSPALLISYTFLDDMVIKASFLVLFITFQLRASPSLSTTNKVFSRTRCLLSGLKAWLAAFRPMCIGKSPVVVIERRHNHSLVIKSVRNGANRSLMHITSCGVCVVRISLNRCLLCKWQMLLLLLLPIISVLLIAATGQLDLIIDWFLVAGHDPGHFWSRILARTLLGDY